MPKREWIPTALRRRVQAMPCVICGIPFGIHCDHIIPVAMGWHSTEANIQPLCQDCNYAKKHLKDNADTRAIIVGRGLSHFVLAFYRHGTRFYNPYDRPSLAAWRLAHPADLDEAQRLFEKFSGRTEC